MSLQAPVRVELDIVPQSVRGSCMPVSESTQFRVKFRVPGPQVTVQPELAVQVAQPLRICKKMYFNDL